MTTQKQAAANKSNALKSTGAKTPAGKSVVAGNAIKHGILSSRILLEGEDAALFGQLRDEMTAALRPVGILEVTLAGKIAAALWKHRRLIEAEAASIELSRSTRLEINRKKIKTAMGLDYTNPDVEMSELEPIGREDVEYRDRCRQRIEEFKALDESVLEANDLDRLAAEAPLLFELFKEEAESDDGDDEPMSLADYLGFVDGGLSGWCYASYEQSEGELKRYARRELVQAVAKQVMAEKSAPIGNELLMRYQVALDGELYRAMDQLRKQQAFRLKIASEAIDVDAEVVG